MEFVNILRQIEAKAVKLASSLLLFSGHNELENGLLNERNRLTLIRIINHVDLIQKLSDQDLDLRQKAEDSKERERNLEQQLSAESAANQELQVRS